MRERCQVPVENKHLFARPGALSHYRGADCIRLYAKESGAKHPEALCSTKLRRLPELQGKGLDGITIDPQDEMDVSSNSSSDEAELQTSSCRSQENEDHMNAGNLQDEGPQDEGLEVSSKKKAKMGSQKAHVGRPKSPSIVDLDVAHLKPGPKVIVKRKWSEEEVNAVEKHMLHFIHSCRVPGKADCVSCLLAETSCTKKQRLVCC
ncbi:uncharacterized protein LOC130247018 [Danio aesculapii]|uniref:uncharacterized protein LOC130247018 n=1 Tax=Danio aesculapii TaxID=1142201 RepID=UPI0024BFBB5D|nr:uncharacterized protein LOC130247018 [Danio aesculapii]